MEAKTEAAMAILASASYLWDFFLSHEAHTSLGLAQDNHAYVTLRELLGEGKQICCSTLLALLSHLDCR